MHNLVPLSLFVGAGLALWVAALVQRRPNVRGATPFLWLAAATAWWCIAGACDDLAGSLALKVTWAKLQYLGIAAVGPLWLLFAAQFAGVRWVKERASAVGLLKRKLARVIQSGGSGVEMVNLPWNPPTGAEVQEV